jgi:hypothetical protein
MYVIESRGSQSRARVINPRTNAVLYFATRAEARAHADSITPSMPSKELPLVVVKVTS